MCHGVVQVLVWLEVIQPVWEFGRPGRRTSYQVLEPFVWVLRTGSAVSSPVIGRDLETEPERLPPGLLYVVLLAYSETISWEAVGWYGEPALAALATEGTAITTSAPAIMIGTTLPSLVITTLY
jgi:hypothetical protein